MAVANALMVAVTLVGSVRVVARGVKQGVRAPKMVV
jgi:hypothetical protein